MTREDKIRRILDGLYFREIGVPRRDRKLVRQNAPANDFNRALDWVRITARGNRILEYRRTGLLPSEQIIQKERTRHPPSFLVSLYEKGRLNPLQLMAGIIDAETRGKLIDKLIEDTGSAPDRIELAKRNYQTLGTEEILSRLIEADTIHHKIRAHSKAHAARPVPEIRGPIFDFMEPL